MDSGLRNSTESSPLAYSTQNTSTTNFGAATQQRFSFGRSTSSSPTTDRSSASPRLQAIAPKTPDRDAGGLLRTISSSPTTLTPTIAGASLSPIATTIISPPTLKRQSSQLSRSSISAMRQSSTSPVSTASAKIKPLVDKSTLHQHHNFFDIIDKNLGLFDRLTKLSTEYNTKTDGRVTNIGDFIQAIVNPGAGPKDMEQRTLILRENIKLLDGFHSQFTELVTKYTQEKRATTSSSAKAVVLDCMLKAAIDLRGQQNGKLVNIETALSQVERILDEHYLQKVATTTNTDDQTSSLNTSAGSDSITNLQQFAIPQFTPPPEMSATYLDQELANL